MEVVSGMLHKGSDFSYVIAGMMSTYLQGKLSWACSELKASLGFKFSSLTLCFHIEGHSKFTVKKNKSKKI